MLSWLKNKKQTKKELTQTEQIRDRIIDMLRDPIVLRNVEKIAGSRTSGIWRIKRAKIILLTNENESVERIVLEVRVPPESVIKCRESFAHLGIKYFCRPRRNPTRREAAVERMLAILESLPVKRSALKKQHSLHYIGHDFSAERIETIREIIQKNPLWSRSKIARAVCERFDLRKSDGEYKTGQLGQVLIRMAMDNLITLPVAPVRQNKTDPKGAFLSGTPKAAPDCNQTKIKYSSEIQTIQLIPAMNDDDKRLWRMLIQKYHYISNSVLFGAQMRYLVYGGKNIKSTASFMKNHFRDSGISYNKLNKYFEIERGEHLLATIGFSACAWKISGRDRFIGWNDEQRTANLRLVVNNARFLILPWINVPNLASRILGNVAKQLPLDWDYRYHYRPVLMETFVQTDLFSGTCYRAANWIHVGQTKGYSLYSRYKQKSPTKDIYVYPLTKDFREKLYGKN